MKISISFEEMQRTMGYINTLFDKSVDEKMKNVIFLVGSEGVTVVGHSPFTFSRVHLSEVEMQDIDPNIPWNFQVKASDINKILSSYTSLSKTKADTIIFEENDSRIRATVHEVPLKEEDSRLEQYSHYQLDRKNILQTILDTVLESFPSETDSIMSEDLGLYLGCLSGVMDSSGTATSKLNFADDYVFVINSHMSSFMVNRLPDAFRGITLNSSSISFLNKMVNSSECLSVAREGNYLCVSSENIESFMRYQKQSINYKAYLKDDTSLGIVLDRAYLKDVLKRMGSVSPEGKASCEDDCLYLVNEAFEQNIPLENSRGNVSDVCFSISVPILEKSVISDVSDKVFIYFIPSARGYFVKITDACGIWFSVTQVVKTNL